MSSSTTDAPERLGHESWRRLGSVPPAELRETAVELHWAAQLLASAGQTFVEPRDDDSHRAMSWDEGRRSLVGAPFAGAYPFRVALRPMDLTLQLLDRTDQPLGSLPLAGHARESAYEWLALGLATYMGGLPPAFDRPDYDMPPHPVGGGAPFSESRDAERATLAALFTAAAGLLSELARPRGDASPVVCWPHHFDIATLITLKRDDAGQATSTVGVGMTPYGAGQLDWYWYVTPSSLSDLSALPELVPPGAWHVDGWTGAVLHGHEVIAARPSRRRALVHDFIERSVAASVAALSR